LLTFSLLGAGTMYAATAAKGVFSVAPGKTVQFANANSVYSENDLIQWAHLGDVTDSGWDVLTGEEWSYLLASGRTNAANLNNLGTVNGQKGLVILPDDWSQPEGTTYAATPQEYTTNTYSTAQWAVMAEAGAVFLPCAGYGYRDGSGYHVADAADHGSYWAKDAYDEDNANRISFNESTIHDFTSGAKTNYYSVILVREVTVLDEEDESSAFATKLDAADDKDFALVRRTLKKDGTLYTLCLPFDVPNIDNSPLAGAEVYTFNGGTVGGSTGSEVLQLSLSRLTGKRLTQGVPYLLRWGNTGETLTTPLYFENVENWDDDTNAATDPGNATVKMHGVYPKTHIPGYETAGEAHYNFFLGANNTLYWPDDATYTHEAGHDMRGFRAYFYITPGGGPSPAPSYRNMPTVWEIEGALGSTTGVEGIQPSAVSIQKELREGQIILIIDGERYDLQGRRL
jgi:hypothetical protein